jgi:hypothetical protein
MSSKGYGESLFSPSTVQKLGGPQFLKILENQQQEGHGGRQSEIVSGELSYPRQTYQ